eukprot:gene21293-8840_t
MCGGARPAPAPPKPPAATPAALEMLRQQREAKKAAPAAAAAPAAPDFYKALGSVADMTQSSMNDCSYASLAAAAPTPAAAAPVPSSSFALAPVMVTRTGSSFAGADARGKLNRQAKSGLLLLRRAMGATLKRVLKEFGLQKWHSALVQGGITTEDHLAEITTPGKTSRGVAGSLRAGKKGKVKPGTRALRRRKEKHLEKQVKKVARRDHEKTVRDKKHWSAEARGSTVRIAWRGHECEVEKKDLQKDPRKRSLLKKIRESRVLNQSEKHTLKMLG